MKMKVSPALYDAWKVLPPCEKSDDPFCHSQCPYYDECYTDDQCIPFYDEE